MNDETRTIENNRSDKIDELAAALAKAQGQMRGALKDTENPFFKSQYADLASVWDACRGPLSENGLAVIQIPERTASAVKVSTMLAHTSGQWISCSIAATPKDAGPQALGSVITYLRRYGLAAMVGVAQVDDDGETGEGRADKTPKLTADQVDQLITLMEEEGLDMEESKAWLGKLARRFGVAHHSNIAEKDFGRAKSVIVNALAKRDETTQS